MRRDARISVWIAGDTGESSGRKLAAHGGPHDGGRKARARIEAAHAGGASERRAAMLLRQTVPRCGRSGSGPALGNSQAGFWPSPEALPKLPPDDAAPEEADDADDADAPEGGWPAIEAAVTPPLRLAIKALTSLARC